MFTRSTYNCCENLHRVLLCSEAHYGVVASTLTRGTAMLFLVPRALYSVSGKCLQGPH